MQACDLIRHKNPSFRNDHSIMSAQPSTSIPDEGLPSSPQHKLQNDNPNSQNGSVEPNLVQTTRSNRPLRACTVRAAAKFYTPAPVIERRSKQPKRKERKEESRSPSPEQQCNSRIVTPLVTLPVPPSLVPRWGLRSMWELASILNFLHVFRHLLNINVEFSVEELETALLTPNGTLSDVHIPLLKAIPPVTRMALGRGTWVTVLCRKLRDWWHWVAEGDIPIVASHGTEVDAYNALEPSVRVVILKALCDIRVEQEDIRSYIDSSIKHGVHLSAFRKERVGGDSHGISYWYEDDPIIGHRLYRQIRTIDVKKVKGKGSQVLPNSTYQWETVATNLDEFQDVSEKLFSSKNRTEASLGMKLKNDMLPEIEKVHKRKERLLKKQHREALLLDNYFNMDELGPGRSLRDRKPVTYTFDDFDRSISEAIKITKHKQPSPEPTVRREGIKPEASTNGRLSSPSQAPNAMFSSLSPHSPDYDDFDDENQAEQLDRSNRRRQRPQRYSEKEFVEAPSENEADFDSDDIVGEAVYDDEYLKKRKQRQKLSSSSEGDEEYNWDAENGEDEEEEEEDEEDYASISEDSDEPRRVKKLPGRTRNETKSRSVNELQSGLRRSKRATKNRINYRKYDGSESETDSFKPNKSKKAFDENFDASDKNDEDSDESNENIQQMEVDEPAKNTTELAKQEQNQSPEKSNKPDQDEVDEGVQNRHFLDLNELAPGSSFDDVPNSMKDKDTGNF